MTNTRHLLSSAQAAEYLGVGTRTVSRLVRRGELVPAAEIDGGDRGRPLGYLFDARDVEILKLKREAA